MVRLDERKVQAPGAQPPRRGIRVRDRRSALARLVGVLVQHLGPGQEAPTLSARLEAGLQEALRAKAVRLRENPPPYVTSVRPQDDTPGCACAEVPTRAGTERVVLEATFDPGTTLDAWDRQLLAIAAQLAALVVELDRYRCAPAAGHEVTRRPDFSTPPADWHEPGDVHAAREHREGGLDRLHRADSGRERGLARNWSRSRFIVSAAGVTVRSSRSTARRSSSRSSRRSCSGSRTIPRRECAGGGASSSTRTAARSSSMRSRT